MNKKDNDSYDYLFKVVLVGDSETGKTNLLSRFTKDEFTEVFQTTIGVEFGSRTVNLNGKAIKAQVWDMAGQEKYMAITSAYYRGAVGAIIVYDITNRSSFARVDKWIKDIKSYGIEDVPILLAGNKFDLEEKREVPTKEASEFADKNGLDFMEISVKTSQNVYEVFEKLLTDICNRVSSRKEPGDKLPSVGIPCGLSPSGLSNQNVAEEEDKVAELDENNIPDWAEELMKQVHEMREKLSVVDRLESTVNNLCKKMEDLETKVKRLETIKVNFKTAQAKGVRK